MGKYSVTREQWQAVMGEPPATEPRSSCTEPTAPVDLQTWASVQAFLAILESKNPLTPVGAAGFRIVRMPWSPEPPDPPAPVAAPEIPAQRQPKEPPHPPGIRSYHNAEGSVFVTDDPAKVKGLPGHWLPDQPR